jgi:uncharacterized membrane protein
MMRTMTKFILFLSAVLGLCIDAHLWKIYNSANYLLVMIMFCFVALALLAFDLIQE